MHLFLIGPGGAGKTTTGKILAEKLGHAFVDLDDVFMTTIGDIDSFITTLGYNAYVDKNSEVFYSLLQHTSQPTVFALSSGFLIPKDKKLVKKHAATLRKEGLSILLLPSEDRERAVEIIVKRQMQRGLGYTEANERRKIQERFTEYQKYGDLPIYSQDTPENIAKEIKGLLTQKSS